MELTEQEKQELIETLKDDLANRPRGNEYEIDFVRDMMEQTLANLTSNNQDSSLTKEFYEI